MITLTPRKQEGKLSIRPVAFPPTGHQPHGSGSGFQRNKKTKRTSRRVEVTKAINDYR